MRRPALPRNTKGQSITPSWAVAPGGVVRQGSYGGRGGMRGGMHREARRGKPACVTRWDIQGWEFTKGFELMKGAHTPVAQADEAG